MPDVVRDALEDRVRDALADGVPAHVRHLLSGRQLDHAAGNDVEASVLAALLADGEQGLLTHADAEERAAGRDVFAYGLDHVVLAQVAHGVGSGADAGHDERVGCGDLDGILRDGWFVADVGDGARDATQVSGTIVDDDDLRWHGVSLAVCGLWLWFVVCGFHPTPRAVRNDGSATGGR